jgi:hypothetical protein
MAGSSFNLNGLTLSTPVSGVQGAKLVPLSYQGKPVLWQPDTQTVAFEPSAFQNEASLRVNMVMRASQQATDALTELDEFIMQYCAENSEAIFGKVLPIEDVRLRYNRCLKQSDKGYEPTFKAKIMLSGKGKLKCWDDERKPCNVPDAWIGCVVQPRIVLKCLWVMPKEFGCLLECTDVLIHEACEPCAECPF